MVELYVENLKKSIEELELDKELEKYVKQHLGKMLEAFGIILGLLLLPLSGCSSYFEFSSEYGIGKNKPYRVLERGDFSSWVRLLRRLGTKLLAKIVKRYHHMSDATKSRNMEVGNVRDIDFDQLVVVIQAKKDWHTKNYRIRTLQLTPALYNTLKEHKKLQTELGVQCEYVFTYKGVRIKNGIDATMRKIVREAGLENVTLHTLRHTFASQLVMAGVPLRDVQELMGHRSFETTLRYAHLSEDHVKKQVLKLPFAGG